MKQVRLKDVCIFNPPSQKYTSDSLGTFLPMENIGTGFFNSSNIKKFSELYTGGYTPFQKGDVIRAIVTPCFENLKGALIDKIDTEFGFGTTELLCLRAKKISKKYLYYYSISYDFYVAGINSMKGTGGLKRINNKLIANLTIPVNNIDSQTAIANYLDYHTLKIDNEVAYLEKKYALLEEYKQSLIFETVTKGLDKNVPMKDSGIEWIGEIPAHWKVKRVDDIFDSPKTITTKGRTDVLSLTLNGVIEKDLENTRGLSPESYDTYQIFKKNDLVFKLIDLANYQTSRVGLIWKNGIMSSAYIRLSPKKSHICKFSYYQFFDLYLRRIFNHLGGNGVRSAINRSDLLKFHFVTTDINEQTQIADFLDIETTKIDKQRELMQKKIELLKEYKQSLIYEAVTGKIEIPQEFYKESI